jgi:hypothetical protein
MNVDACTPLPITTAMSRLDLGIGVSLPGAELQGERKRASARGASGADLARKAARGTS